MPKYTSNLGLAMPYGDEYFNINSWNANMRILDEAYALLIDDSGEARTVNAASISYDPTSSGLSATNVQSAIDIISQTGESPIRHITVDQNMTIEVPSSGHLYVVLAFGQTLYNVTFTQSDPNSGKSITWQGGQPSFGANNVYELSFLDLDCRWFKRMQ